MKIFYSFFFCLLFSFSALGQLAKKEIKIKRGQTYLNFPVKTSNDLTKTRIKHKDEVFDEFLIKLTDKEPDFWTFIDVSAFQGERIELELETKRNNKNVLEKIFADSIYPGVDSVYKEEQRPQVHFSSRRGWLNDPNGLIYHEGEYHLFYQHNPYGKDWGNMHWGHAVSKDLLHWKELPVALYTPKHEDMAFSGSAVIDEKNTSGFRKDGIDPLIAFYTSTGRGESIALSYDNGRTFNDYEKNPIIEHKGRDPKVFWYEPGEHWVMVLWDEGEKKEMSINGEEAFIYQHLIFTSPDLKEWSFQSGVEGFFECPELFELPVENGKGDSKWVMYDATGRYVLGDFNGKNFIVEQQFRQFDYGGKFYASQTYNNAPENRRIQIGWARGVNTENVAFNQSMTFPTELILKESFDGLRLCPTPVKEIETLYSESHVYEDEIIKEKEPWETALHGDTFHILAEFETGDAHEFGLNINGYELSFNQLIGRFNNDHYSNLDSEIFKIEVIIDKTLMEIFINDGELYYVDSFNPQRKNQKIEAFVRGPSETKSILKSLKIHELSSIWKK